MKVTGEITSVERRELMWESLLRFVVDCGDAGESVITMKRSKSAERAFHLGRKISIEVKPL